MLPLLPPTEPPPVPPLLLLLCWAPSDMPDAASCLGMGELAGSTYFFAVGASSVAPSPERVRFVGKP